MNSARSLPAARRSRRHDRGAVMLEALIASLVFALGLVGAYQGIIVASRQNSMANRLVRAAAISQQLRSALEVQGYGRLVGTHGVLTGTCQSDTDDTLADGLGDIADSCVIDVEAHEANASVPADLKLEPGYPSADGTIYKRVLVAMKETDDYRHIAIVVRWREMGQYRYHKQFVMVLRPTTDNGKTTL